jgi:hypothetical protein
VDLTQEQYLQSIWAALRRIEDNMALPPAPLELPPINVAPPDLAGIVTAVTGLKSGPTADEIAAAIAGVLTPSVPQPDGSAALREVAAALEKLDFRLKGLGTQAYGGGSVTLQPNQTVGVTSAYQTNQTGTWGYYAGVSGTVNVTAGQRVLGIAAHATTAGSMTINGGASVPIPATTGIQFSPVGTLVAPVLVFTGTDSYACEVVS